MARPVPPSPPIPRPSIPGQDPRSTQSAVPADAERTDSTLDERGAASILILEPTDGSPARHLLCPSCPRTLHYVSTHTVMTDETDVLGPGVVSPDVDVHVYECAAHGRFHVGPHGRLGLGLGSDLVATDADPS